MKKTTKTALAGILGALLLTTGCAKNVPIDEYEKVLWHASWEYNYGSVEELSVSSDIVAVVKITDAKLESSNGLLFTKYSAKIEQSICGNEEEQIEIIMTGGINDTEKTIYEIEDDPLMQINDEFLIFAHQNQSGTYTILSGSQGRFEIKDDRVYSLNESNDQVKKANIGSNITVNGKDKDEFINAVKSYTA